MSDSKKLPFNFTLNINTQDGTTSEALQEQRDIPFCIAMMGNFSGREPGSEKTNLSDRIFIEIDRYNYDEVLASMVPQLSLSLNDNSDSTVDVPLHSLKDFQPDNLYKNVEVFGQLRDLRDRLNNPETFKKAMEEISIQEEVDEVPSQEASVTPEKLPQQTTEEQSPEEPAGSLLDSILDETEGRSRHSAEITQSAAQPVPGKKSLVDTFIQQVAAGRKTVSRDARQDDLVASVDEAIAEQMRRLLHNPQFQALEAVWRAVHFMVKRIRSGKAVKLYLLDVSRNELASDLAADDVTQSQLYKQFCDTSVGDISWSLIIGDYRFGADIDDMRLLSQLGAIAQQASAHFIAAADEKLLGCTSFAETPKTDHWLYETSQPVNEAWALLRKSPVAKTISLALPRFILRTPYGSKAAPVKAFAFEEMSGRPEHEDYLWGNPAFVKAEQIARAFMESGWEMQLANVMNTEDMPVHYYEEGGLSMIKPCAEIPLTDTGASKMIAQGLIPLWSVKNRDRIHSGDFHSIGE